MQLTEREKIAIKFMSDKMEVTAGMIGIEIYNRLVNNPTHIGGSILGNLYKKGLALPVPELKAWQLSKTGVEMAKELKNENR